MPQFGPLNRVLQSLLLPAMLLIVSGCDDRVKISTGFPPANLVRVKPEPVPGPEVFTSDEAAQLFNSTMDEWGREGWSRIGMICRDATRKGALYPDKWCPEAPKAD